MKVEKLSRAASFKSFRYGLEDCDKQEGAENRIFGGLLLVH